MLPYNHKRMDGLWSAYEILIYLLALLLAFLIK